MPHNEHQSHTLLSNACMYIIATCESLSPEYKTEVQKLNDNIRVDMHPACMQIESGYYFNPTVQQLRNTMDFP